MSLARRGPRALAAAIVLAAVPAQGEERPALERPPAPPAIVFEENRTQPAAGVRFVARGRGYHVALTDLEAVLALRRAERDAPAFVRLGMAGGAARRPEGFDRLPGRVYYSTGAPGTLTGHPTFRRVKYADVYPGIDVIYYGNDGQLEFDFIVAPGADPDRIRLAFAGADSTSIDAGGNLVLRAGGGEVQVKRPVIYQEREGVRTSVPGAYVRAGRGQFRISLGEYDSSLPLVIDPIISFATYLGGPADESARAIDVSPTGETYLLGLTNSGDGFPTTHALPLSPPTGHFECFVTKLSSDGSTRLYSVLFQGVTSCLDLALDPDGSVHLSMGSSVNMVRTLTENPDGTVSLRTLKGVFDFPNGPVDRLAVDGSGNVYLVAFHVPESDFRYDLLKVDGTGLVGSLPIFTPFLDTTDGQNELLDRITALAVDAFGVATVVGEERAVSSLGTPRTRPAIEPTPDALQATAQDTCCSDGFVVQIDTNDPQQFHVRYASYLGGSASDVPFAVANDEDGATYIAGASNSPDFPTTPGAWAGPPASGTTDAFTLKLDAAQSPPQLVFSTMLGVGSSAQAEALAVLPGGTPVIAGNTSGLGFPLVNPLFATPTPSNRAFISAFSPLGDALTFSSFLDNSSSFHPLLATNGSQFVYVSVETEATDLATPESAQPIHGGSFDVLARKLDVSELLPANAPPEINLGPDVTLTATSPGGAWFDFACASCSITDPDGDPIVRVTLTLPDNSTITDAAVPFVGLQLPIGTHAFRVDAQDARGAIGTDTLLVTVLGENTFAGGVEIPLNNDYRFDVLINRLLTPVRVTFDAVTQQGLSWVSTRMDQDPPVPAHLQAGTPPVYYDIFTTAQFTGSAQVCLDVRGMSLADPASIDIYRLDSPDWTPLSSFARGTDRCAATSVLNATFAIFYSPVPETAITTIAGTGVFPGQLDGDPNGGPESRDNFVDGGPAASSAIGTLFGGAVDRVNRLLYFTTDGLFRMDLDAGTLHRVAGSAHRAFSIDGPGGDPTDDPVDGLPALSYPLNAPAAVAVGPDGNVYFTERIHAFQTTAGFEFCGILKLDVAAGTVARVAGAPPGLNACTLEPGEDPSTTSRVGEVRALAFDAAGHLFFTEAQLLPEGGLQWLVRRVDALTGAFSIVAGGGTTLPTVQPLEALDARLPVAEGISFDADGHLVVMVARLWRLAPGPDGLITGVSGAGEELLPLTHCGSTFSAACPDWPLGGDGLAISNHIFLFAGLLTVADDGSILITQGSRLRRIRPGADGVVKGDEAAEIVESIAGFEYDFSLPIFGGTGFSGTGFYNGDFYATNSTLASPVLALDDADGRVLILDSSNRRIRRIGLAEANPDDTDPPVVTAPAAIAIAATEATGARSNVPNSPDTPALLAFLAGGTASDTVDANPTRQAPRLVSCGDPSTVLGPIEPTTVFAVGQNCVEFRFTDASGNVGAAVSTVNVAPPIGGHVNGAGVLVVATDLGNVPQPPKARFNSIGQPGLLTTIVGPPPGQAPPGFEFNDPTYDLRTTAFFAGPVDVCIQRAGLEPGDRLFQLENGVWVDRTTSVDPATSEICGTSASLGTFTIGHGVTVVIMVEETVTVTDEPAVTPALMVAITENIIVTDSPAFLPSVMLGIVEQVTVLDAPGVRPSVLLGITEQVIVTDAPAVAPEAVPVVTLALTPATATTPVGTPHTVTAVISDGSDESGRVILSPRIPATLRVQFRNPDAPNSPLSVTVQGDDIIVSLATNAAGALVSTAGQVAAALNASPGSAALVTAAVWPGTAGNGIVQPRPLAVLPAVQFAITGATNMLAACVTSVPGICAVTYTGAAAGTDAIAGYLDVNGNVVQDAGEPSAAAAKIWEAPACAALAGPEIRVTRSGFRLNRATGLYTQTVTLQNIGAAVVSGPISLVVDGLSANATLTNRTGLTSCSPPPGSPYVDAPALTLAPGQSTTITLNFANPSNQGISYTTRVLTGNGAR